MRRLRLLRCVLGGSAIISRGEGDEGTVKAGVARWCSSLVQWPNTGYACVLGGCNKTNTNASLLTENEN